MIAVTGDYTGISLIIAALFTGVATLVTSIGGLVLLFRTHGVLQKVELNTNSLAERAEILAKAQGTAEGNLAGRLEQTAERKEEQKGP